MTLEKEPAKLKVAIVTGASSDIGRATVLALTKQGVKIVIGNTLLIDGGFVIQ